MNIAKDKADSVPHRDTRSLGLSKENYGKIANLLRQFQMTNTTDENLGNNTGGAVNFAGIVACNSFIDFNKLSCECFKAKFDLWILDSGATHHMTFDKTNLSNISHLSYPLLVRLPNVYRVKVTQN